MTISRRSQVCLSSTRFYHCVTRCVRRAFLFGRDRETGRCFNHRKHWIERRIQHLTSIFAVDICAYAVMDNHYHVVLHINDERARKWSNEEIINRWYKLFRGIPLVDRHLNGELLSPAERSMLEQTIALWRTRLYDLSWFMRCINEPVARWANGEDGCKGRFWEGRYKCQALLDEAALLACMAYVDLNPIRAGMAKSIETSRFTSAGSRINSHKETAWHAMPATDRLAPNANKGLPVFMDPRDPEKPCALPVTITEYLQLIDWTGRAIRDDKRGHIPEYVLPVCQRLHIESKEWTRTVHHFGYRFYRVAGALHRLHKFAQMMGRQWLKGRRYCRCLYKSAPT